MKHATAQHHTFLKNGRKARDQNQYVNFNSMQNVSLQFWRISITVDAIALLDVMA